MKTKEKRMYKSIALILSVFMIISNALPIASYATDNAMHENAAANVSLTSTATQIKAGETIYVDVHVTGDNIASFAGTLEYDTTIFEEITTRGTFVIPNNLASSSGYGEWRVDQYSTSTKTIIVSEASGDYYNLPGDGLLFRIPLVAKVDATTSTFNIKQIQVDGVSALNKIDLVTLNLPSATAENHTLTVDPNGGTYTGETTVTVAKGSTTTLAVPTKTGSTFLGWEITTTGTTATLSGNVLTMGSENVTVQAKWQTQSTGTFTLIIDPNEGTYSEATMFDLDTGEAKTLATPTRTGYSFLGWEIVTTGTTATLSGSVITMGSENIVVRAKWQLGTVTEYTLTIDLDGGTSTEGTTFQLDTGETKTLVLPTKTGYNFGGWEIVTAGTTATINDSLITMGNENITIKAKWIEKLYLKAKTYQVDTTNNSSYIIGTTKEYTANDLYILNISAQTTLSTFISRLDTNGTISVKKTTGTAAIATDLIGTGMTLEVNGTNEKITLTIVVAGDIDGDGKCTITDLSRMNNVLNQAVTLEGAYNKASDMDYSGSRTISDLSRLNQYITGTIVNLIKLNN